MTKEELKQEAEEYGLIYADREAKQKEGEYSYSQIVKAYERGALDFTEPREKRIAELEAQIEKMKSISNCKYGAYMVGCTLDHKGCRAKEGCDKWELKEND